MVVNTVDNLIEDCGYKGVDIKPGVNSLEHYKHCVMEFIALTFE